MCSRGVKLEDLVEKSGELALEQTLLQAGQARQQLLRSALVVAVELEEGKVGAEWV